MTFKEAFFSYGRVALDSILNDIKKKSKNKKLIAYLPRYICSDVYQKFSEKNICVKRSNGGISAIRWRKILGKKATKNFKFDEKI